MNITIPNYNFQSSAKAEDLTVCIVVNGKKF